MLERLGRLMLRPLSLDDDGDEQRLLKRTVVPYMVAALFMSMASLITGRTSPLRGEPFRVELAFVAVCISASFNSLAYLWLCWTRKITLGFMTVLAVISAGCVLLFDLHAGSAMQPRAWPLFVLLINVFLVCKYYALAKWLLGVCSVWVILTGAESGYRFGLYDLPYLPNQDHRQQYCQCDVLPCAVKPWAPSVVLIVGVCVLDFTITHAFAVQVDKDKAALQKSVDVVGQIARFLAAYDLGAAGACIEQNKELSVDMTVALTAILQNLRAYKPFLPDALFNTTLSTGGGAVAADSAAAVTPSTQAVPSVECANRPASVEAKHTHRRFRRDTAFPGHYSAFTDGANVPSLAKSRISLLAMRLHCDPTVDPEAAAVYHTASLAMVLDAVRNKRGALDRFLGDRIYASFNAFRPAPNYGVKALDAARAIATVNSGQPIETAVVTGAAHYGYLGTDALRSPTVVGTLVAFLEETLRAGCFVNEELVCCQHTAAENVTHPLRLMLHAFRFRDFGKHAQERAPSEDLDGRVFLYAMQTGKGGEPQNDPAPTCEWMYALGQTGAAVWREHNTAAMLFHTRSLNAALSHLRIMNAALLAPFLVQVARALTVDFRAKLQLCQPAPDLNMNLVPEPTSAELDSDCLHLS